MRDYRDPWDQTKQQPVDYCPVCGQACKTTPRRYNAPWTGFEHELVNSHLMEEVRNLAKKLERKESTILWEFKRQIEAELK